LSDGAPERGIACLDVERVKASTILMMTEKGGRRRPECRLGMNGVGGIALDVSFADALKRSAGCLLADGITLPKGSRDNGFLPKKDNQ
jgi:hypothetical protein